MRRGRCLRIARRPADGRLEAEEAHSRSSSPSLPDRRILPVKKNFCQKTDFACHDLPSNSSNNLGTYGGVISERADADDGHARGNSCIVGTSPA